MDQLTYIIYTAWDLITNWWWVPLPFILWRPFLFLWLWWRREVWMFAQKKVLLEIKIPQEVLKPLRAMEQVFTALWGNTFDPPDRWEKWIDGKTLNSLQFEIVSIGGEPHFFVRCLEERAKAIEASIYSQYPDAEISVVDDYTKNVPRDIPNKDWELWGTDYMLVKSDVYPIKTYSKFFEEKPEIAKEEKRIDPLSTLLEGMGKLGPGEQLWVQIEATAVLSKVKETEGGTYDFVAKGREIADKIARRPEKAKAKSILLEAAKELITGEPIGEEKKEESIIPPEMKLTPGERDVLGAVEGKIAQRCFVSYIRFIYLARREVYFGGAKAIPFGFFNQFATENFNALKPWPRTLTRIKKNFFLFPLNLIRERRIFVKKRRLFFRYINRFSPIYPKGGDLGLFILSAEELATIFHFPGRAVAPAPFMPRIEIKKGEAPADLPTEE